MRTDQNEPDRAVFHLKSGWGQPCQTQNSSQTSRGPRPVLRDGIAARAPGRESKSDRYDQRVVGISQHRDEIRDEVDRRDQIHQQHAQPDPDPNRQGTVRGETLQQAQDVRGETKKIHQRRTTRVFALLQPQHKDKHQPQQDQPADDADDDDDDNLPPLRHDYESSGTAPGFGLVEVLMTRFSQRVTATAEGGSQLGCPRHPGLPEVGPAWIVLVGSTWVDIANAAWINRPAESQEAEPKPAT